MLQNYKITKYKIECISYLTSECQTARTWIGLHTPKLS